MNKIYENISDPIHMLLKEGKLTFSTYKSFQASVQEEKILAEPNGFSGSGETSLQGRIPEGRELLKRAGSQRLPLSLQVLSD